MMMNHALKHIVLLFAIAALAQPAAAQADYRILLDPGAASTWTVDERIFGRFHEHNGRDAYPGLFAQHLSNASFEPWYEGGRNRRTSLLYHDVERQGGVAYPWERVGRGGVWWDHIAGGVNGGYYQRVTRFGDGRAGVRQRIVLPDRRTRTYDVQLSSRGSADAVYVRLRSVASDVLDEERVPLTETFRRDTVRLELPDASAPRYRNADPYGEYVLTLEIEDDGFVDLDAILLMSGDAVRGKFNAQTVEWLRDFNVTSLRWPGGNWASAYYWRDGVGPLLDRPVRRNLAWGGLEPNYLGTNEFLELCELAGVEPLLNAAYNYTDIPPEEAARWVEYVNGDTTTPMGRLRAQHGHPEPYGVALWQVGNESYGPYQIGHEPAADYARRIVEYVDAMKAVDPTITIIVSGNDPLYPFGGNAWNETLLEIAGDRVEVIDIHRYISGVRDDRALQNWEEGEYLETTMAFPTQYEDIVQILRRTAAEKGVPGLDIAVGEWNVNANVRRGWADVDYPNMMHATFVAGMYNAFIRQGDAVRYAYQRDNTLFERAFPVDMRPVNPGAYTLRLYAELIEARQWHHLPVHINGPTFDMRQAGPRQQPTSDVPHVDAAALTAGDSVLVFLNNRSVSETYVVDLELDGGYATTAAATITSQAGKSPAARQDAWTGPAAFSIETTDVAVEEGRRVRVEMAPATVVRIVLDGVR